MLTLIFGIWTIYLLQMRKTTMKTVTQIATIQTKSTPIRKKLKDQNYRTLSTNLLRETNDLKTKIWKHELEN